MSNNPFTAKAKKPNPFSTKAKKKPKKETRGSDPNVYVYRDEAREEFGWLRNGMTVNVTYPFDPAHANGHMNKTGVIDLRGDFFDVNDGNSTLCSIPLSFKWPNMKITEVKPKRKPVRRRR